jgi:formylglycine-generating enzyme required for sulfatase activity
MNSRKVWLLLVSFLLVCGLIGCGEKPQPVVGKPEAVPEEPKSPASEPNEMAGSPVEITNSIGMKLRLIPAGDFMMGSPNDGMAPQHKVRITKPFYIGVYEVTQAEYEKLMGENPSSFSTGGDGAEKVSGEDTSSHPVESVRWEEAVEFCKRLSAKEGKIYRLPTEAEWEYACRAGSTTRYNSGDDHGSLGEYAWHSGNSDDKPHSVGEKKPNAWGLRDMHGNVWEWCADWYGLYDGEEVSDPSGPEMGTSRVIRGGCWGSAAETCRAAYRIGSEPWNLNDDLGFRVAAVPSNK